MKYNPLPETPPGRVDLRRIFLGLQEQMKARLQLNRAILQHPVSKGDASEAEWIELLSTYLPRRYQVEKAFVIDHHGSISLQIDLIIFDRHYSPFLFHQDGQSYVPAESVYGAFEVKQDLTKGHLEYASDRIASVRRLARTSAPIIDCGSPRSPRKLPEILGGLVCLTGSLSPECEKQLQTTPDESRLDLGCVLGGESFEVECRTRTIEKSTAEDSLVFFFLKLLSRLQALGTVPPMEIGKYAAAALTKR